MDDATFPTYGVYILLVWSVLTIVWSLVGNTGVLIASLKYHAIKFDKTSVVLIENIAAVDIANILLVVIPYTINLSNSNQAAVKEFYEESTTGRVLCLLMAQLQFWLVTASILMTCALSFCKLSCLACPLRVTIRSARAGYCLAVLSYLPYTARIITTTINGDKAQYNGWIDSFTCLIKVSESTSWVDLVLACLLIAVPGVFLIGSTMGLIYFTKKTIGIQRQIVVVNISISSIVFVTFLPYIVFMVWLKVGIPELAYAILWQIVFTAHFIMLFVNPIIYYRSSSSFKGFVNNMCLSFYRAIWMNTPKSDKVRLVAGSP